MKLKQTREQSRKYHLHSRELLNHPQQEPVRLPQLEALLTSDRRKMIDNVVSLLTTNVAREVMRNEIPESLTELSRALWAAAVLDQVLAHPVVSTQVRTPAVEQLLSPHSFRSFKRELLDSPSFESAPLLRMAAVVQFEPSAREHFEIDDDTFTRLLKRFSRWEDRLPVEDKPWVLAYLAMIRPDKRFACEALLRSIGDDGVSRDHGQFIWDMRKQMLRQHHQSWEEGLVGVRLLEVERELDEEDKSLVLEGLEVRLRQRTFDFDLQHMAYDALLLVPHVGIAPNGKVLILGSHSKLGAGPELPQRPMI